MLIEVSHGKNLVRSGVALDGVCPHAYNDYVSWEISLMAVDSINAGAALSLALPSTDQKHAEDWASFWNRYVRVCDREGDPLRFRSHANHVNKLFSPKDKIGSGHLTPDRSVSFLLRPAERLRPTIESIMDFPRARFAPCMGSSATRRRDSVEIH